MTKKLKGIDVSNYNGGIDYTTLGRNIDFVIPQSSYGRSTRNPLFLQHVNGFRAAGTRIPGVYHFIYAISAAEAKANADLAIRCVREAGLPKSTYIWCDFEYHTVDKALERGVKLGPAECDLFTRTFCDTVLAAGYKTGIYTNKDYYRNWYKPETLQKYPIWLCDLEGGPKYSCIMHQYSWKGRLPGYNDALDMDYWWTDDDSIVATVAQQEAARMTTDSAINKVISIAAAEIGYLEKRSNVYLDDKTANAGSSNYTKYWRDVYPAYQAQAWCAAFVSWCFMKAFGLANAKAMLKHWPYVYCPTLAGMTSNKSPQTGDIILFYRAGTYTHTGIVERVTASTITTIEGNTSGASGIIANGGGVCRKTYQKNGLSSNTKYFRPDYNLVATSGDILTDGTSGKTIEQLAREVITGAWGNGDDRKRRLTAAGYDYNAVQNKVNELLKVGSAEPLKTTEELAREVIAGKWGNGPDRKKRLTDAGYDYDAVQREVNRMLKK